MILIDYSMFCRKYSIPQPNKPSLYLVMHDVARTEFLLKNKVPSNNEVGKMRKKYKEEASLVLLDRIKQLEEHIFHKHRNHVGVNTLEHIEGLLASTRLYLWHVQQIRLLGTGDFLNEKEIKHLRKEYHQYLCMLEQPDTYSLIIELSEGRKGKGRIRKNLGRRKQELREGLLLPQDWNEFEIMASRVLEGRPITYPYSDGI